MIVAGVEKEPINCLLALAVGFRDEQTSRVPQESLSGVGVVGYMDAWLGWRFAVSGNRVEASRYFGFLH